MVVISETPNNGSNGGEPNKKRKELQKNLNKKLKGKEQSFLAIPDEVIISCFALVQRCHYVTLSHVSNSLKRLLVLPELYVERSNLRCTECVLYAYVGFPPFENPRWYILHRKPYPNVPISVRLGKIGSLPPMPWGSAVVTMGSKIYVIGGCVGEEPTSDLTLIDCESHKYCSLPRMNVARCRAAAGLIDGKIYVIGGCRARFHDWVEVFDINKQTWSGTTFPIIPVVSEFVAYVVMDDKIYMRDNKNRCYAFEPKDISVKSWGRVTNLSLLWQEPSCVIDGILFSVNLHDSKVYHPIIVYDPEEKFWRPLKGLEGFPANIVLKESTLVNFGGKLVVLGADQSRFSKYGGKKEIWCVEIVLERKEGGETWGQVESVAVVLTPFHSPSIQLCRTVTV